MKRVVSFLILLAMLLVTFSSCGETSEKVNISADIFEIQTSSDNEHISEASSKTATSSKEGSEKGVASESAKNTSKASGATPKNDSSKTDVPPENLIGHTTSLNIKKTQKIIFTSKKNSDKVKTTGRVTFESAYGLSMFWTGSSIEMNLDCEGEIKIRLNCEADSSSRIKIYVDNVLFSGGITTVSGITDLTVATGLEEGIHNLKLVRSDDCEKDRVSLTHVELTGTLAEKPEDKMLYIKAFGGSQVIGWGNLLSDDWFENEYQQSVARDRKNQDGTLAYPMVAAGILGADISIIGRQGAGVALTWHASDKQGILENLYGITAPSLSTAYTQTRVADIILIDDGEININPSLYSKNGVTYTDVTKKAMSFLNMLRADHPGAKIIWCYGIDHNSDRKLLPEGSGRIAISSGGFVRDIIAQMGGEAMGFYSLKMEYNPKRKGYPSVSEHNAAGVKLAEKIQEILK